MTRIGPNRSVPEGESPMPIRSIGRADDIPMSVLPCVAQTAQSPCSFEQGLCEFLSDGRPAPRSRRGAVTGTEMRGVGALQV